MVTIAEIRESVLRTNVDLGSPGRVAAAFVRERERAVAAGTLEKIRPPRLANGEWKPLKRSLVRAHLRRHGEVCPGVDGSPHPWRAAWTIDHVVPRSLGGTNDLCNLDVVCSRCNERRMPWALWWYVLAEDFGALGVSAEADRLRQVFEAGAAILDPDPLLDLLGAYGGPSGWTRMVDLLAA